MLPDAAHPATYPGSWQEIVPVGKEGMAWFLPSRYRSWLPIRVSRYNADYVQDIYSIYKFCYVQRRGPGLSPVTDPVLRAGAVCKNHDKQITFIDRVGVSFFNQGVEKVLSNFIKVLIS